MRPEHRGPLDYAALHAERLRYLLWNGYHEGKRYYFAKVNGYQTIDMAQGGELLSSIGHRLTFKFYQIESMLRRKLRIRFLQKGYFPR